jgi:hypothetical protein
MKEPENAEDVHTFKEALHQAGIEAFGNDYYTAYLQDESGEEGDDTLSLNRNVAKVDERLDKEDVEKESKETEDIEDNEDSNKSNKKKRKRRVSQISTQLSSTQEQESKEEFQPLPSGVQNLQLEETGNGRKVPRRGNKGRHHKLGSMLAPPNNAIVAIEVQKGQGVFAGPYATSVVVFGKKAVLRFGHDQEQVSEFPVIIPPRTQFGVVGTGRRVSVVYISPYIPDALSLITVVDDIDNNGTSNAETNTLMSNENNTEVNMEEQ